MYNTGKVCLSLLNTWSGDKNEKWIPGTSTMLQVLVSIQGLILNPKPYFNEPGYAQMSGSVPGEKRSLQYNESTFILSLRTMMYIIRRPPKVNFVNILFLCCLYQSFGCEVCLRIYEVASLAFGLWSESIGRTLKTSLSMLSCWLWFPCYDPKSKCIAWESVERFWILDKFVV